MRYLTKLLWWIMFISQYNIFKHWSRLTLYYIIHFGLMRNSFFTSLSFYTWLIPYITREIFVATTKQFEWTIDGSSVFLNNHFLWMTKLLIILGIIPITYVFVRAKLNWSCYTMPLLILLMQLLLYIFHLPSKCDCYHFRFTFLLWINLSRRSLFFFTYRTQRNAMLCQKRIFQGKKQV